MNDIITESEITTHPKMLELTSNKDTLDSKYIITTVMYNGNISTIVFSSAIKAMGWLVLKAENGTNDTLKYGITKMVIHKGSDYIEFEYDMPITSLNQEAFIEANLAIGALTKSNG